MAQRDATARSAGARRLHTFTQIIQTADIIEEPQILLLKEGGLPLLLSLLTLLTLRLRKLGLRLSSIERVPGRLQLPRVQKDLPVLPSIRVRLQSKVHKLGEKVSRLLHTCQVGSTEVGAEHEAFDGGQRLVPGCDERLGLSGYPKGQLELPQVHYILELLARTRRSGGGRCLTAAGIYVEHFERNGVGSQLVELAPAPLRDETCQTH